MNSFRLLCELLLWGSLALLVYTYVLYPLLVRSLAARMRVPNAPIQQDVSSLPTVAVIIAGYNEERHVAERISNVLQQNYPPELLRVYFGSDGSSDGTEGIATSMQSPRVIVRHFSRRRGKASVLNDLVALTREEILAFSDANSLYEPNAVRRMVEQFRDRRVGAVCGELDLVSAGGAVPDGTYWRLEKSLKLAESQLGGLLGANGAIYAMRKDLYQDLPPDTIIDDFVAVMRVAASGYDVIYVPTARAVERAPDKVSQEFRRRARIGHGNYQAFFRYPEFFTRTNGITRFTYFSHKVLRWFAPHLMLVALVSSAFLAGSPFYSYLLGAQVVGYLVCAVLTPIADGRRLPPLLSAPLYLVSLNVAFLVGFWRWLAGSSGGAWERTSRA